MKQSISIKLFLDHPFLYSESQTIKNYCSILIYILCVVTLCLKSNDSPGRRAAAKIKRMSQEVKNWKEVVVDGEQQGQVVHHEGRVPHSMSPSSNKVRKKKPKRR